MKLTGCTESTGPVRTQRATALGGRASAPYSRGNRDSKEDVLTDTLDDTSRSQEGTGSNFSVESSSQTGIAIRPSPQGGTTAVPRGETQVTGMIRHLRQLVGTSEALATHALGIVNVSCFH